MLAFALASPHLLRVNADGSTAPTSFHCGTLPHTYKLVLSPGDNLVSKKGDGRVPRAPQRFTLLPFAERLPPPCPCTNRSAGRQHAPASSRGIAGTRPKRAAKDASWPGAYPASTGNAASWDYPFCHLRPTVMASRFSGQPSFFSSAAGLPLPGCCSHWASDASRGSTSSTSHPQAPLFRFLPQTGQRPAQSG